jgi:hypothetical protein
MNDIIDKLFRIGTVCPIGVIDIRIPTGHTLHAEVFVQGFVDKMNTLDHGHNFPDICRSAPGQTADDGKVVIVTHYRS